MSSRSATRRGAARAPRGAHKESAYSCSCYLASRSRARARPSLHLFSGQTRIDDADLGETLIEFDPLFVFLIGAAEGEWRDDKLNGRGSFVWPNCS